MTANSSISGNFLSNNYRTIIIKVGEDIDSILQVTKCRNNTEVNYCKPSWEIDMKLRNSRFNMVKLLIYSFKLKFVTPSNDFRLLEDKDIIFFIGF